MNLSRLSILLLQGLFTASAIIMSIWARLPWAAVVALAILGACAMTAQAGAPRLERIRRRGTAVVWLCTLMVPASLLFMGRGDFRFDNYLDKYFATLAWLVAASILPATSGFAPATAVNRWKLPVITWAFGGAVIWVATAYWQNQTTPFYLGLIITIALLVLCHLWFRLSAVGISVVNTLLLLLIGLPLADLVFHPAYRLRTQPDLRKKLYSYEAGTRDPSDFAHWWNYYLEQWKRTERDILNPSDDTYLPYRLRPGSEGLLMQSRIAINRRGFRGKEIAEPKGNVYRIVALGGSTTFGITLNAADRPWPELLEDLVRERLHPRRPVEVVNAGVAGYTLAHNLHRFARDILPLHPDMIVCYHGINSFPSLVRGLSSNLGKPPPAYQHRPVRLLADCEYRLKLMRYERHHEAEAAAGSEEVLDPMQSDFAQDYRDLIAFTETNGIRLALATFSMAVNERSEDKAVEFYGVGYRMVPRLMTANNLHTTMIHRLCAQHPGVVLVDTRRDLDGRHECFIDLVHFSPEGEVRMAETVLAGICELLEAELSTR